MKPATVHYQGDRGTALCRFIPRATLTDFAHEVTCAACKARLDSGPGTTPFFGGLVDCPHCHRRHGGRYACDQLLAAAAAP